MRERARKTAGEQPTVFSLKSRRIFFARPSFGALYGARANTAFRIGIAGSLARFTGAPRPHARALPALRREPWPKRPERDVSIRPARFPACWNISRNPRRSVRRACAPTRKWVEHDSFRWRNL